MAHADMFDVDQINSVRFVFNLETVTLSDLHDDVDGGQPFLGLSSRLSLVFMAFSTRDNVGRLTFKADIIDLTSEPARSVSDTSFRQ